MRDDGPAQSHTSETSIFTERVDLDGTRLGSLNLEYGLGNTFRADERSVGSIEYQNRSTLVTDLDQLSQLLLGSSHSSRVIGTAEVNDVSTGQLGKIWEESVIRVAWHVYNSIELLISFLKQSSLSLHDTGININRVTGILNSADNIISKHYLKTHDITLGTITDKYLGIFDQVSVKFLSDLRTKGAHSLLSAISTIGLLDTKLRYGPFQSTQNMFGNGHGGVANT
mmetsp:Transcript_11931/g.17940  ORF Transcript_11931/g.17940 Transcript_11931/m.17940 type:complete len:226 (-) Transcript_11931:320-997(-)